jgi:hypothetical protein
MVFIVKEKIVLFTKLNALFVAIKNCPEHSKLFCLECFSDKKKIINNFFLYVFLDLFVLLKITGN